MSKGNTFENDFLKLVLQGTAITGIADNTASAPLTSLYLSLHTADPGEGGTQATSECNYTSYARQAIDRDADGFSVSGNVATLVPTVAFPAPTNGTNLPQTATHWAVGVAVSGASKILWSGELDPDIVITNTGVTPRIVAGSTITED